MKNRRLLNQRDCVKLRSIPVIRKPYEYLPGIFLYLPLQLMTRGHIYEK